MLEKKSRNAFKSDDSENFSAVDMPNQDDDEATPVDEEAETERIQREHAASHTKVRQPSEEEEEEGKNEHHKSTEELNEEGGLKVREEHTKKDHEGRIHKLIHEHIDMGDRVEHRVRHEHTSKDGQMEIEESTGVDRKKRKQEQEEEEEEGEKSPAPSSPSI